MPSGSENAASCVGARNLTPCFENASSIRVRAAGPVPSVLDHASMPWSLSLTSARSCGYGALAPTRAYMDALLADVVSGKIDPSPVFDLALPLAQVAEGYKAMDERRAVKVLLTI